MIYLVLRRDRHRALVLATVALAAVSSAVRGLCATLAIGATNCRPVTATAAGSAHCPGHHLTAPWFVARRSDRQRAVAFGKISGERKLEPALLVGHRDRRSDRRARLRHGMAGHVGDVANQGAS
jgi:hypothetical protein